MSIKLFNSGATALAVALVASPCLAADETTDEDQPVIEEIIVTAEKREESILDVPLTMSAFSGERIEELGMTKPADLEQMVPGLQFGDNGEQAGQGTVIRGIGTRLAGETHTDLAVATYVDGVYTLGTYGVAPNFFDLERVEVARGPQGTLHGRNSIAGSISYYTRKPTDEWDALVQAEFTDQVTQRLNVAFGGPISEHFSFRIAAGVYQGDGAQENIGPGGDYDEPDQVSWSPQLRFKTDRLDLNARWAHIEDDGAPRVQVPLSDRDRTEPVVTDFRGDEVTNTWYLYEGSVPSIAPGCPHRTPGFECGSLKNKLNVNRPGFSNSEGDQAFFYGDFDLTESYTLRYNYGWSDVFQRVSRDVDGTTRVGSATDPLLSADGGVPFEDFVKPVMYEYDEQSHELQFVSNLDGPFNFITGIFVYKNETTWSIPTFNYSNTFRFTDADAAAAAASPFFGAVPVSNCQDVLDGVIVGFGIGAIDPSALATDGFYWDCPQGADHTQTFTFATDAKSNTRAIFFSADYQIDEQWLVSGGLRYTEDEKEQGVNGGWIIGDFLGANLPLIIFFEDSDEQKRTWDATIGHISLEYTPVDDRLIYGRVSTGYRAGGFNSFSLGAPSDPIKEETLVNYEIGMKGIFLDDSLQLSTAVFFNDFEDYQIVGIQLNPVVSPTATTPLIEWTDNIQGTTLWGGEFDFIYYVNEHWRLSGYYSYLDSEIGEHAEVVRGNLNPVLGTWDHIDLETGLPTTSFYVLPQDMTGNELPMQAKHKFALTVTHTRSLGDMGNLQLLSTYSFTDVRHSDLANNSRADLEAYGRWDARATFTSVDDVWSATFYVQNILDDIGLIEYLQQSTNSSEALLALGTLTDPRQFGVEIRWRPRF